jgi:hypothetical protein
MMKKYEFSRAYRCGWIDGRFGELRCFTDNPRLAEWERASDRLEYYRGHRAGRELRQRRRSGLLLKAS